MAAGGAAIRISWRRSNEIVIRNSRRGLAKHNRKQPRVAYRALRPSHRSGGIQPKIRHPPQPFLHGYPHFHPREIGADATVYAKSERDVRIFAAIDHDSVRIDELVGITI